jgi:hypothetical protein
VTGITLEKTAQMHGKLADRRDRHLADRCSRRSARPSDAGWRSGASIALEKGRIKRRRRPARHRWKVWAGGDCVAGGEDLTVVRRRRRQDRRRKHSPRPDGLRKEEDIMADLSTNFIGIKSPNPFWLASAPPTDKAYNVERAFEGRLGRRRLEDAGRAGPPVVNVNGPRYGAIWGADRRLLGLNNIELITDRDLEINLREIKPR